MPCYAMHPIQDLFWESFSYELQFDMHSYLHKNFILAKSGCYTMAMMARPSSSGSKGVEPPSKKVCLWSVLPVSFRYAHGVVHWYILLPLLMFLFLI
jgi:hypothetical protein